MQLMASVVSDTARVTICTELIEELYLLKSSPSKHSDPNVSPSKHKRKKNETATEARFLLRALGGLLIKMERQGAEVPLPEPHDMSSLVFSLVRIFFFGLPTPHYHDR